MFAQGTTGVPYPDPSLGALAPPPYSPSRCRLCGSPTDGSGSRSRGSSEVQAFACLPSPSHRKSSSLAETSPGAAPGACCEKEAMLGPTSYYPS